jgi:hypothetical protein
MESDTVITDNIVHALGGSKVNVDHEELTDTDLSQKLFYEGITKVVGIFLLFLNMVIGVEVLVVSMCMLIPMSHMFRL